MKELSVEEKLTKARATLVLDHPFFGSLILRLNNKVMESIQTAATDGKGFYYNPNWVKDLSIEQTQGLLAHEVMHLACGHHTRCGNREHDLWNQACDYAIDPIIQEAGFELPDQTHIHDRFKDMGAEKIYEILLQEQIKGDGGSGGSDEDSDSQGENQSGGNGRPKNDPGNDPGGNGGVQQTPPAPGEKTPSPSTLKEAEDEWKIATIQAAQQAKQCGNIPGAIAALIESMMEKKLDWKTILRDFMEKAAKNDYNWLKPNRRYNSSNFILPGLRSDEVGTIVIGVDTSGSISLQELEGFAAEISGILMEFPSLEVEVIYCDTDVRHTQVFDHSNLPVVLEMHGGGGTRFTPVFEHIEKNYDEDPRAVIYFTDLWCSDFPKVPPPYPTLWIDTESREEQNDRVPFGIILPLPVGED